VEIRFSAVKNRCTAVEIRFTARGNTCTAVFCVFSLRKRRFYGVKNGGSTRFFWISRESYGIELIRQWQALAKDYGASG
jgi:hypothetical protein